MKKSATSGGAPSLDILAAKLRIVEVELSLEEREVNLDGGGSFMAEPNLNCKIEVVKNLIDPGVDEGVKFFDRFKLKKDDDGEWAFLKYSKLGNLIRVRYSEEWFDSDADFEESDFEGFEFIATVQPKTDSKGKQLKGSVIDWESIRPAGGADEKEAAGRATMAAAAEKEEEDFKDIPF